MTLSRDCSTATLRADLVRTMKLLGCASVQDLSRDYLGVPPEWLASS